MGSRLRAVHLAALWALKFMPSVKLEIDYLFQDVLPASLGGGRDGVGTFDHEGRDSETTIPPIEVVEMGLFLNRMRSTIRFLFS
jgi:hypothetical protein